MQHRSTGTMTLSVGLVVVGLYCQMAAVALLLSGTGFAFVGGTQGAFALVLGVAFLGLTIASYAVAYGTWTHKHWSWTAAVAVFVALIAASVGLAIISTNLVSAVLPSVGATVALLYLQKPAVHADLLGDAAPKTPNVAVGDQVGVTGSIR